MDTIYLTALWIAFSFVSLTQQSQPWDVAIGGCDRLWIAFSFVSLTQQSQLLHRWQDLLGRCELLSVLYLWHNNHNLVAQMRASVALWIAFSFVSLTQQSQRVSQQASQCKGCELLSVLYLWHNNHNGAGAVLRVPAVVNCFQFCIFDTTITTQLTIKHYQVMLWIAFSFVSLTQQSQHYLIMITA